MAAMHAYKFTHFYAHVASPVSNPKETGIGKKLQAIFLGVDYPKSTIKSWPNRPYDSIALTNSRGEQIKAWHVKVPQSKGSILMLHGHGASKGSVVKESSALNEMGYSTLMIDFRAHGQSDGSTCTIGFEDGDDIKMYYDWLQTQTKDSIILWGVSMGAAAILKAMHTYADLQPQKVILEMPFGALSDAVKGRVRMMGIPQEPISTLLTFWGGIEQGFWAFDYQPAAYAKSIHCPVLLQWGQQDQRVTQQETAAVFENLGTPQKKLVIYPTLGHESLLKGDSKTWLASVGGFLQQ